MIEQGKSESTGKGWHREKEVVQTESPEMWECETEGREQKVKRHRFIHVMEGLKSTGEFKGRGDRA